MKKPLHLLLLVPVVLSMMACGILSSGLRELKSTTVLTPTEDAPSKVDLLKETKIPEPSASPFPTNTPLPTPSPTVQPPTITYAPPTSALSPTNLPLPLQQRIFNHLWQIVKDEYLYADFNGLDWDAIRVEYQAVIDSGLTNEAFYFTMDEMLMRLGDEHSAYYSPEMVAQEDAAYAGDQDFVGIGILSSPVPVKNLAVILIVFPGSPADRAGLQPHDSLLEVNGEPILDEYGFLNDAIQGLEGTILTLKVQKPGEDSRIVTLVRERISGTVPVPYEVLTTSEGKKIGYVLLVSFNDMTVDDSVKDALDAMNAGGPLDGLIIDNRNNNGGTDTVLRGTLSYFTSGEVGYFINRSEERPLRVMGEDIHGSQSLPLVVLVGVDTASYGEVFAGILQDLDRAYLIGENTYGNVETLWGYDFEDGSRAWIAHDSFRPLNNQDADWETNGIIPDLSVTSNWEDFTISNDPAVLAALDTFDND
ncbi:MAG: PDZ domain-containing protein [Chloroflexi bacterium]|nr:MAG: PDZ domain-containing protein [Chloroflexota bacterium]